jgi:glycosyltransferase involved in cell wall biosynthesis
VSAPVPDDRIKVMFLQSQYAFGADSQMHALLMRHLDRTEFEVEAACVKARGGREPSSFRALSELPDLPLRRVNFGPTLRGQPRARKLHDMARAPAAALSLGRLALDLRRRRFDVLHATEKPRDAVSAVALGRLSGAKSVLHMHIGYHPPMNRALEWSLRRADHIVCISEFVAATLVDHGFDRDRLSIVHNAIDLDAWSDDVDGAPVREELGIPADAAVVLILARLFRSKGHLEMLQALQQVRERLPVVQLLIAGHDDVVANMGAPFSRQLRRLTQSLGLEQNVRFLGHRPDVAALLAASDVLAVPSHYEPFGIVFLEAMAMRTPVVAFRSGGAPEVIEDGETGLLARPLDVDDLARCLIELLESADLRRRMGEAGRRHVEREFSPQRMAAGASDVYRALAGTREHASVASGTSE